MQILFRDSKGRFCKHTFKGNVRFRNPVSNEIEYTKGLSHRKVESISRGIFEETYKIPSEVSKEFPIANIMKTASKAYSVRIYDRHGALVDTGYSGEIRLDYYDKSGKVIGEYKLHGISKEIFKLVKPREIREHKQLTYHLGKKDGKTLWSAIKNKKIAVNHMGKVWVTIKIRGEYYSFPVDLSIASELSEQQKHTISKQHILAYEIRKFLFAKGFRFSGKSLVKSEPAKEAEQLSGISISISKIM